VEEAGSFVLPVENPPVTAPINDAVPLPTEGAVVPVVGIPSGGTLLKFHWATISARVVESPTRMRQASEKSLNTVVCKLGSWQKLKPKWRKETSENVFQQGHRIADRYGAANAVFNAIRPVCFIFLATLLEERNATTHPDS
jgi:hypothetical protein